MIWFQQLWLGADIQPASKKSQNVNGRFGQVYYAFVDIDVGFKG